MLWFATARLALQVSLRLRLDKVSMSGNMPLTLTGSDCKIHTRRHYHIGRVGQYRL